VLLIFSIVFGLNCIYAINETQIENTTNLTIEKTTAELNDSSTNSNHTINSTSTSENTTNSSNSTETSDTAAGEDSYTNVQGIWLSTSDVGNVNVTALVNANVTDIFVKANLISNPTYQNILTTVIQKFTGTGIRIHAWITCFKDTNGNWINPANETQRTFLLSKITDIVSNYNIDGIQLDYVRYPGTAYKHDGTAVITSFVKDVYNTVKGIKAKVAISAAVMPERSQNGYYYGQDYAKLAPYLDFIVPMIYKGNYKQDTEWIGSTAKWIAQNFGGKPVLAGIQTYESDNDITKLPADELQNDINSAIENGASGYVLFRYGLIDSAFFTSQNGTAFTIDQMLTAASWVKNYVDTNRKLPDYVTINGVNVGMPSFLKLLTTATLNIQNNDLNSVLYLYNCIKGAMPRDDLNSGNMSQAEYLKLAGMIKSFMDKNGVAPEFYENGSLGRFLGYENMIYMYSSILSSYKTNNTLPNGIPVKPWKIVTSVNFTLNDVLTAASWVKNYVDTNRKLPDYVTINGVNVGMPSFLKLLTTATLNIQNNDLNSVLYLYNCIKGAMPRDDLNSGNMSQAEYLKLAGMIKSFMDKNGVAPEFYENGSLGRFLGYENMIYMYSSILSSYKTNNTLPNGIPVKPWKIVTSVNFTLNDVLTAASWVKNYVDTNRKLPDYVTINGVNVGMPSFLKLLTTATLNIQNNDLNSVLYLYNCIKGAMPRDDLNSGNMSQAEYLKLAGMIKSFMDKNGVAPEFYENGSLGRFLGYENMIYMYSSILSSYKTNNTLPNGIPVKPWKIVTSVNFTLNDVLTAASWVKNYVDTNRKLPDYVTINGVNVGMPSFLKLLTTATLNIQNNDLNSVLYLYNCIKGAMPRDDLNSGNMSQAEYLKLAGMIKSFMDKNGVAPEFYENGSLGRFLGYENMIYMYSKVLDYYSQNNTLPSSVKLDKWIYTLFDVPNDLIAYTQPSNNCQSDNPAIIALANSLIANANSARNAAENIFNWVRDKISYSFYANTKRGAVRTLNDRTGNCVDQTHLLIALSRAAGIPAKYMHGTCTFFTSGNTYGHVWAEVWVNGRWYSVDTTSSRNTFGVIKNWNTKTVVMKGKGEHVSLPF
jgi:uncharacterized protein YpmS